MSNSSNPGELITPSPYRPWCVTVVSAVPQSIMRMGEGISLSSDSPPKRKKKKLATALDASQINAGAVCQGWSCLASAKGNLYVWPTTAGSNNSSGSSNPLVSPSKHNNNNNIHRAVIDAPKSCVSLYHPGLAAGSTNSNSISSNSLGNNNNKKSEALPILIALTPASNDSVFVYAAQPNLGSLVVWKVTMDDVRKSSSDGTTMPLRTMSYAQTGLPLQRQEDDDSDDEQQQQQQQQFVEEETVTSLTVLDRHMVVMGTSLGGIICCTQTTIPVSLHAQRMLPSSASGNNRLSLMGYLFQGNSQVDDSDTNDGSPIVLTLPLGDKKDMEEKRTTKLLAVSLMGNLVVWTMTPTVASSHKVASEAKAVTSLAALFREYLTSSHEGDETIEALQAETFENRLHLLVRTTPSPQAGGGDCRLYWVRLQVQQSDDASSSSSSHVKIHWVDCQWLNRFPAPQDVFVVGLVLAKNGLAYAAFHQRSGGVTSSVIVMALSDNDDGTMNDESTVYEVDLPMNEIPALLPHTFANDVVTHGCCVLARSGLGIRVRVLPPESSSGPLSPRAVSRANPSAVLKLTNHVSGAFWQYYRYLDGSCGGNATAALPPSVLDASPVDLEEAIIAFATELHVQRSSDGAGWSLATSALSSNGLEWHLSFIDWLRAGGLYRSLTTSGKWRLLSLGQEVASFLELLAPISSPNTGDWEQAQFANLNLSDGIAPWLRDTLNQILQEGNAEHYQLWCGWLSTALATATTYREERSASPYDITVGSQPPKVGSTNDDGDQELTATAKVPIWTSCEALQDIFGTLFQHWNLHPKQYHILPPQTVEVCIRAGLISFEDAASSASSLQSLGNYSGIKKISIPLLRTLHPLSSQTSAVTDDELAFDLAVRHDYYEGICQIAYDHENKDDSNQFRLEPLLQSTTLCQSTDYQSDYTFGQFVMRWHADLENFGHTLVYGRLCPENDLNYVLKSDERLHKYRWIQGFHRGDFDGAAFTLMERAQKSSTVTLKETKWSLCMAKLSNRVLTLEGTSVDKAESREKEIELTLELVGVQKELLGNSPDATDSQQDQHLWSAIRLHALALEKVDQAVAFESRSNSVKENATRFCYMGLLVSITFEDPVAQRSHAVEVWTKSIVVDWDSNWAGWIRNENDLSSVDLADAILDQTVFGSLLQECDDASLAPVTFSIDTMMLEILEQLGLARGSGHESLRRLLTNVAATLAGHDEEMEDAPPANNGTTMMAY